MTKYIRVVALGLIAIGFSRNAQSGAKGLGEKHPPAIYVIAVGINTYSDSPAMTLRTAESDARMVFSALTNPHTGLAKAESSTLLLGAAATRAEVLRVVSEYRDTLKQDDVLVMYWAGHSRHDSVSKNDVVLFAHDSKQTTTVALAGDLLPAATCSNIDFVFIGDGCHIGAGVENRVQENFLRVSFLSSSKRDEPVYELNEGSLFTQALDETLISPNADLDRDGLISVEELFVGVYPKVVARTSPQQHPTVSGTRIHRVPLARAPVPDALSFEIAVPNDIAGASTVLLNGNEVSVRRTNANVQLIPDGADLATLGTGLAYVTTAQNKYLYWREEKTLKRFENPYQNSYAIVVAIEDYQRARDPKKRGPSAYESRGMMIQRARELVDVLTQLGFPRKNVIELYDHNATSGTIESVLKTFWKGGTRADADRLFFYFGGHGDDIDGTGILVTYDFEKLRPTQTAFLMGDLITRHAENITARHVLFTLDACASGLTYKRLGPTETKSSKDFAQLSIIRNDTAAKARNFLVAGTDDQPVLWDKGGIFTRALIAGLRGAADTNRDRLIQFFELTQYVSNEVTVHASMKNVRQQVEPFILDRIGTGKVIFLSQ